MSMRQGFALVLVLVFLTASCIIVAKPVSGTVQENSWVEKAPMPTARGYLDVAVVNGKIYAIGGSGPIGTNEEYDPATDVWTTKSPMPTPEQSFAIAVFQEKIYCIGGLPYGNTGVNEVYDPATDSWETKAAMPTARYGLQANVVNGKMYCMGGVIELGYNRDAGELITQEVNTTEVYDPSTDTWTTKAAMPNPEGYVSAVVDSKIYIISPGLTQIYDPATDTWSTGSPPPVDITPPHVDLPIEGANNLAATAAATTGTMAPKRIYVYDGNTLQIYDPKTDSWTNGTAAPTSRQYLGIGVVEDKLYFIGGMSWVNPNLGLYCVFYATNEQYTPLGYGTIPPESQQEPFPTVPVAAASMVSAAVACVGIILYLRKHKSG
jgi:N-acetylneuraminic acid mutarotase